MRTRVAMTVLAALLATGCAPVSEGGAVDDGVERSPSPDTVEPEPEPEPEPAPDPPGSPVEPTDSATSQDTSAGDEPAEEAASGVMVSIGDFFFEPDGLEVQAGDTVVWTHDGDITHNVTARDDSFASQNLASGETFAHTFAEPGTFAYRCTLHGQMLATVEVS